MVPEAVVSTFLSPRVVVSGRASVRQLGERLLTLAGEPKTVLLAVDRALRDLGLAGPAEEALAEAGFRTIVACDFGPELTADQVNAATQTARSEGCDAVVGIGGGSVLDAAKLIAVLLKQPGDVEARIGQLDPATERAALVLIPTTVGTGAEVTRISMVTVGSEKKIVGGDSLIPDLAILDPNFVEGLPPGVVGATGMDALAHAVEAVMSLNRSTMTETVAFRAIDLIRDRLEPAYGGEVSARGEMLTGAHLAGLALNAGVVIGHSLAYSAARLKPMAHGTSCALALPYALAYNQHLADPISERLALALTRGASARLIDAAEAVQSIAENVGQPTNLNSASIPEGAESEMARICVENYPRPNNPEPMTLERVTRLVETMRIGDLGAAFAVTSGQLGEGA
jgi:alcohol dehydrogenase class IV